MLLLEPTAAAVTPPVIASAAALTLPTSVGGMAADVSPFSPGTLQAHNCSPAVDTPPLQRAPSPALALPEADLPGTSRSSQRDCYDALQADLSFAFSRSPSHADTQAMDIPVSQMLRLSTTQRLNVSSPVLIIGVAGGTASGKTTVCEQIWQRLHDDSAVSMLSQDSFYKDLSTEEKEAAARGEFNFDCPGAFDEEALLYTLTELKARRPVDVPVYDFTKHARSHTEKRRVDPADVVIIEGILVLHMERIRDLLHIKVFVDTDDDVRLARRIQRDVACRGRDVGGVIEQYTRFVKPAYDTYIAPSRRHADLVVPWGGASINLVAVDLITEHIRGKLGQHVLRRVYPNLMIVPSNYQIRGMHTILRDRNTSGREFVFYAERLIRLVVEAGLGHLPFEARDVVTPTGHPYGGVDYANPKFCGVSIIRSGEAMEGALRSCCQGIKIGKLLVHRHSAADALGPGAGGEGPQDVVYAKLPSDIGDHHVLLLDAVLATGNSACQAIKALLDRGVSEDRILFLCIIAAPEGVHKVCGTYPRVKLVTSEVDDAVNEDYLVVPGCGNFGDRFFCE